jgi:hypothetical protein
MSYQLRGRVKTVLELMTFDSGFTKRELVVTTDDDRYPQDIKFETVRDKTSLCDGLRPGQPVTVHFDIRGNEYKGRYFVNLNAWRIDTDTDTDAHGPDAFEPGEPGQGDIPF